MHVTAWMIYWEFEPDIFTSLYKAYQWFICTFPWPVKPSWSSSHLLPLCRALLLLPFHTLS
jgi:hypothetical protein